MCRSGGGNDGGGAEGDDNGHDGKGKIQVNAGLEERWRWRVRQALVMVAMLMAEVKARVNRIAMHTMAVIVAAVEMAWKMAVMRETLTWTEMTVA